MNIEAMNTSTKLKTQPSLSTTTKWEKTAINPMQYLIITTTKKGVAKSKRGWHIFQILNFYLIHKYKQNIQCNKIFKS